MACPICGTENEATATFCLRCGARLRPAAAATGETVALRPADTPPFGLPVAEPAPPPAPAVQSSADIARVYEVPAAEPRVFTVPSPAPAAGVSPPTSNNATISLVLALVAQLVFWVLSCATLGTLSALAAAAAIPAVIVGRNARREIRASNGSVGGDGLAKAGIILGWITIGLSALALLIILAVIVGGVALFAAG